MESSSNRYSRDDILLPINNKKKTKQANQLRPTGTHTHTHTRNSWKRKKKSRVLSMLKKYKFTFRSHELGTFN